MFWPCKLPISCSSTVMLPTMRRPTGPLHGSLTERFHIPTDTLKTSPQHKVIICRAHRRLESWGNQFFVCYHVSPAQSPYLRSAGFLKRLHSRPSQASECSWRCTVTQTCISLRGPLCMPGKKQNLLPTKEAPLHPFSSEPVLWWNASLVSAACEALNISGCRTRTPKWTKRQREEIRWMWRIKAFIPFSRNCFFISCTESYWTMKVISVMSTK